MIPCGFSSAALPFLWQQTKSLAPVQLPDATMLFLCLFDTFELTLE